MVRHIDCLAVCCTSTIWIGPLPQSLACRNKQQSLHSIWECNYLSVSELLWNPSRTPLSLFFLLVFLVSLSRKMSNCKQMKFHCLCIYSLWSRDYWLYKVIQTDEWILYWLKCKYGLMLGSSHTARGAATVFIVLHCQPEEQKKKKVFSLNCWLSCSNLHQGLGILGNEKKQKMRGWYWFYNLKQRAPFSLY